jgi:membrane dipeptidase
MRLFSTLAHLTAVSCWLCACSSDEPPPNAAADADKVHAAVIALDTHVDIEPDFATEAVDPLDAKLQVNLTNMAAGGLDAAFFIVYVAQTARTPENYAQARADALTKFGAIHRMAEVLYPQRIEIAYTASDVERIAAAGKLVAAIGIENGYVIGEDLALIDEYAALGARYLTLVHNGDNDLGRSAQPKTELGDPPVDIDSGLTSLGAQAIARLNRAGIMVDVSHASKRTALDAIRLSAAPVIASHSGVRGLVDHPRNMDDETLIALRDNGGVIQIVAFDAYLKAQPAERGAALRALRGGRGLPNALELQSLSEAERAEFDRALADIDARFPRATVADLIDQIDYAVRLIGIDHVGLSSDFGGGGGIVGWADAGETMNVTRELVARGYGETDIAKLWSGNLLRVWHAAERVAAEAR